MSSNTYTLTVWKNVDGRYFIQNTAGYRLYDPPLGREFRRFQRPEYSDYKEFWFKSSAIRFAKRLEKEYDDKQRRGAYVPVKVWR